MEENFRNKLGFWAFFLIILTLLIGGYFFTKHTINNFDEKKKDAKEEVKKDLKIDKKKDYIYFENEELISDHKEIIYKDVIINLNTQTTLTETLKKENRLYKNTIQYISKQENLNKDIIVYNNDDLYALNFREYKSYEYKNYVSLVINDFNYTCFADTTFQKTKSYIFNTLDGSLVSEEELLDKYNTSLDSIKKDIKEYLIENQTIVNEVELIKVDETINNFDNYALYINEYGRLNISYLVKTNEVDYNEIMEVN